MFGSRKSLLAHFELAIPQQLYLDWHRCFVFHRLALEAIKAGLGSPVWLTDKRIAVAASSSIDRAHVSLDKGEMSFPLFDFRSDLDSIALGSGSPLARLERLRDAVGSDALPEYLLEYVRNTMPSGDRSIALHAAQDISGYKDADGLDKRKIERSRGFMGAPQMQKERYPQALHHFKIFHNGEGKGRLFYKFDGSIQFIKNLKNLAA
jgi:hypothetical protein